MNGRRIILEEIMFTLGSTGEWDDDDLILELTKQKMRRSLLNLGKRQTFRTSKWVDRPNGETQETINIWYKQTVEKNEVILDVNEGFTFGEKLPVLCVSSRCPLIFPGDFHLGMNAYWTKAYLWLLSKLSLSCFEYMKERMRMKASTS